MFDFKSCETKLIIYWSS